MSNVFYDQSHHGSQHHQCQQDKTNGFDYLRPFWFSLYFSYREKLARLVFFVAGSG